MTNLQNRFLSQITSKQLFQASDKLLLAVSGGVDSIVLAELCFRLKFRFGIAHVNFNLRGAESDEDAAFVKKVAEKYGVEFHLHSAHTQDYAENNKVSVQVAAREIRYSWFHQLLKTGYQFLLTAHHQDDNVETVLMNFFRGTGIRGLRGMQPKNEYLVRPLLSFTKNELIAFATTHHLTWREDHSNSSEKYTRNYFRNSIIPAIEKVFPGAVDNVAGNIERFAEIESVYALAIQQHIDKIVERIGSEMHIPILKLQKFPALSTLLREITSPFNFTAAQVPEIIGLLAAEQGSFIQSSTHRIIKNRKWIIIAPRIDDDPARLVVEESDRQLRFPAGELRFSVCPPAPHEKLLEQLDKRYIKYPLIIRKWKAGDYFYPLGMTKKKKISRFLIDKKLSPLQKQNTWVMESGKRICMVIGLRIDERFKITPSTKEVLTVQFKS